jgi:hypothetical protein
MRLPVVAMQNGRSSADGVLFTSSSRVECSARDAAAAEVPLAVH